MTNKLETLVSEFDALSKKHPDKEFESIAHVAISIALGPEKKHQTLGRGYLLDYARIVRETEEDHQKLQVFHESGLRIVCSMGVCSSLGSIAGYYASALLGVAVEAIYDVWAGNVTRLLFILPFMITGMLVGGYGGYKWAQHMDHQKPAYLNAKADLDRKKTQRLAQLNTDYLELIGA